MVGDTVNVSGQSNCTPVKVPECRLSEDLGQLFQSSSFSDVYLCVGGHDFRVHKSILAGGYFHKTFFKNKFLKERYCIRILRYSVMTHLHKISHLIGIL